MVRIISITLLLFLTNISLGQNHASSQNQSKTNGSIVKYNSLKPCTFSIDLPINFTLEPMYSGSSLDYCDYFVKTDDTLEIIELHSLINGRFEFSDIIQLYYSGVHNSEIDVRYKMQKNDWFVVSGIDKKTGNNVYWKRISGKHFISDLHIEYPEKIK